MMMVLSIRLMMLENILDLMEKLISWIITHLQKLASMAMRLAMEEQRQLQKIRKKKLRQLTVITQNKTFEHAYGTFKSYLFVTEFSKTNTGIEYQYITNKALSLLNTAVFIYSQLDPSEKNKYLKLGYYERILFRSLVVEAFNQRNAVLSERDAAIADKNRIISEKDTAIAEKNRAITERDMTARERDSAITERDGLREQMVCLANSVSFRAGRIITFLPRKIRDGLKRLRKALH